jgi:transposase
MQVVHERCCGLDVHKKTVVACILITLANGEVQRHIRTFSTMTAGLLALADWLESLAVTVIAMESTGIYWRPVFNLLEEGRSVILVNAQHMKAIPGRKTDIKDSEWLADLLRHGLRHPPVSFRQPLFVNCAISPDIARIWSRSVRERSIVCKKCWKPPISSCPR